MWKCLGELFLAVCSSRTAHSSSSSEPDACDDVLHSVSSVLLTVLQYPSTWGRVLSELCPLEFAPGDQEWLLDCKEWKAIDSHRKKNKKIKKFLDALEQLCAHKSCNSLFGQEPRLREHFLLTIAFQLCLKSYGRAAEMKKPLKSISQKQREFTSS